MSLPKQLQLHQKCWKSSFMEHSKSAFLEHSCKKSAFLEPFFFWQKAETLGSVHFWSIPKVHSWSIPERKVHFLSIHGKHSWTLPEQPKIEKTLGKVHFLSIPKVHSKSAFLEHSSKKSAFLEHSCRKVHFWSIPSWIIPKAHVSNLFPSKAFLKHVRHPATTPTASYGSMELLL